MSGIKDTLKMILVKMAIPALTEYEVENMHEILHNLAVKQPKRFALAIQSLYPGVAGVLVPLAQHSKTELDDTPAEENKKLLEDLMKEFNIPIPVVVPLDFSADADLPEETV